jgi:Protein of unknown function (DUF2948)
MFSRWFAPKRDPKPLRLQAEGLDDLALLSAVLQDALMRRADMVYDEKARSFTVEINRYCHELTSSQALRAKAVLKFHGVTKLASKGLGRQDVLDLLTITAEPLEAPAFRLQLVFAGEGERAVRLDVECLDILLMDLTPPRRSQHKPTHQS